MTSVFNVRMLSRLFYLCPQLLGKAQLNGIYALQMGTERCNGFIASEFESCKQCHIAKVKELSNDYVASNINNKDYVGVIYKVSDTCEGCDFAIQIDSNSRFIYDYIGSTGIKQIDILYACTDSIYDTDSVYYLKKYDIQCTGNEIKFKFNRIVTDDEFHNLSSIDYIGPSLPGKITPGVLNHMYDISNIHLSDEED